MDKYSVEAGLEASDALQKFIEAGLPYEFIKGLSKMIDELDNNRTSMAQLSYSSQTNNETKQKLNNQVEEIQLTFTELKRVAESVYDLHKKYPRNMPKPIENAWSIYCQCLLLGKVKKDKEVARRFVELFFLGFPAGTIFALKYGNVWGVQ